MAQNVKNVAFNCHPTVSDPFVLQMAFSTTFNQIHVCKRLPGNDKLEMEHRIKTDVAVIALEFSRNAVRVLIFLTVSYTLY